MTTQTVCSKRHRWAGMAEMAWVGGGGEGSGGGGLLLQGCRVTLNV